MKVEEVVSGFIWHCFLCSLLQHISSACILLLNGWQPLTVQERAELADVVVTAYTRNTFKDLRIDPDSQTYIAEFQIYNVLKGSQLVEKIKRQDTEPKIFNISNFGDPTTCYADVNKGESYLLFLDFFDNRLSAKYDDIFGAIADYTLENEQLVLQILGWNQWSEWTHCSKSCGNGKQNRVRLCKKKTCDGFNGEERTCNTFSCSGVKDLLSLLKIKSLSNGVSALNNRPSAYKIKDKAELRMPTKVLYKKHFPPNFSILITSRPVGNNHGLILSITNLKGQVILGVQVGSNPLFLYSDQNNLPGLQASPHFPVNLSDNHWHQFAYSVQGQNVTLYMDCIFKFTRPLLRSMNPVLAIDGIVSLGSSFGLNPDLEKKFEGDIEQLLISSTPTAARHQCGDTVGPIKEDLSLENFKSLKNNHQLITGNGFEDGSGHDDDEEEDEESSADYVGLEWSSWSPCSVTCGKGTQERNLICVDRSRCTEDSTRSETKLCRLKACPIECYPACKNGGQCVPPGICSCPQGYAKPTCTPICTLKCKNGGQCVGPNKCHCSSGYKGNQCHKADCPLGCKFGGLCVAPNKCDCPSGYGGNDCGIPICFPTCQNGGFCLHPYYCHCKTGSSGALCENFTCKPPCKNNGKCIGLNKCNCTSGYEGNFCEKPSCRNGCGNGICISPNKCLCNPGFHGRRCNKKKCTYKTIIESFIRHYKQSRKEVVQVKCDVWNIKTCSQTQIHYDKIYRQFYRATYKCVT